MKYNLTIDIGNTWIKGAYFNASKDIVHEFRTKTIDAEFTSAVNSIEFPVKHAIVSNVRDLDKNVINIEAEQLIWMNSDLKYPFSSEYLSPKTLGMDRVCAIAGGMLLYPNQPLLVITAGTCITFNILNETNLFLGGAISPGISMRYKALNQFTGKLPLVGHFELNQLVGRNTKESILSGVQNGILAEVDGIISDYNHNYSGIKTIMTGGATVFFENKLKNEIFADPNLIFKGLNHILELNVK